jgi:hypothetical protein
MCDSRPKRGWRSNPARWALMTLVPVLAVLLIVPGVAAAGEGDVPADVAYATNPQVGAGNQWSAPYQWWKIRLNTGDLLRATLTVTSAGDTVFLKLFLPGTVNVNEYKQVDATPPDIEYTATQTGDYLFCVYSAGYGDTAYTIAWQLTPAPAPAKATITGLSPTSGKRGVTVTVTGKDFGEQRGSSTVGFGSAKCVKYVSWSDTAIKCKVPAKAKLGKVKVSVVTTAGTSNTKTFTVKR